MRAPDTRGAAPLTAVVAVVVLLAVVVGGVLLTRLGNGAAGTDERSQPDVTAPARTGSGDAGSQSQRTLSGTRALIDLDWREPLEAESDIPPAPRWADEGA